MTEYSGRLVGREEAVKQAPAGRVCAEPECDTVLSRYNASDKCSPHRHSLIRVSEGNEVRPVPLQNKARSIRKR